MLKSRELSKRAQLDYEQARGTAHELLLKSASASLETQIAELDQKISILNAELSEVQSRRDVALRTELSGHLVRDHLMEVPGIGPRRFAAIIRLFKGELRDLHRAQYLIDGIGEQTQHELDKWIQKYERQIPQLLQQSFPGKKGIISHYEVNEKEIKAETTGFTRQRKELQKIKEPVDNELLWLIKINSDDFKRELQGSAITNPEINRYLRGVFSEWEQMPDWFRKALTVSGQQTPVLLPAARAASEKKGASRARTPALKSATIAVNKQVVPDSDIKSVVERIQSLPVWFWPLLTILLIGCCCSLLLIVVPDSESTPTITISPTRATAAATSTKTPTTTATLAPSPTPTTMPSLTPTIAPLPTQTPRPSATPSLTPVPFFVSNPANMRSGPGTGFAVVTVVQPGEPLTLLEANSDQTWYRVALQDGSEGWVGSSVLVPVEE